MLNMDPATLRLALSSLEQVTDEHAEWHANLLRAIFCGTSASPSDLGAGAHLTCTLGRWYYEQAPAEFRELPSFAAMGVEHERLHRIATRLLQEAEHGAPLGRAEFEDLVASSARLRMEMDDLRRLIDDSLRSRDVLTGAYSRVAMLPELREQRALVQRGVSQCCLVFMDIDNLKDINDTYGHQVGDGVLAGAVRYLREHLRSRDKVFRYGGDEFLITLPGADLETARSVITRVREGLAHRLIIAGPGATAMHVTASFGLALLDPDVSVAESINHADQALLIAKTAGRNRAITWDASAVTGTRLAVLKIDETPE